MAVITSTISQQYSTTGPTVAELKALIERAPDNARVKIYSWSGDQREPGYTTITVSWTQ